MRYPSLSLAAAFVLLAACQDRSRQTPTETETPAEKPVITVSSVCAAYAQQLEAARASLASAPSDEALREQVHTYEAVIADACS
jgi:hypothetical protein